LIWILHLRTGDLEWCRVEVFVQNLKTLQFLTPDLKWSEKQIQAVRFKGGPEARIFIRKNDVSGTQLLYSYADSDFDFVCPVL
jgi:hypothetical protein